MAGAAGDLACIVNIAAFKHQVADSICRHGGPKNRHQRCFLFSMIFMSMSSSSSSFI